MRKGSTQGVKGKVQQVAIPSPHPTVQKAHEINQAMEDLKTKYGEDLVNLAVYGDGLHGPADKEVPDSQIPGQSQFPVRLYPKDDYDQVMQVKLAASQDATMKEWQKDFTTQDARYLIRKQEAQTGAAFKAWLATLYDARDPYQAEMLNKVFPELKQEQEAVLRQRAELGLRIALIRLFGPREPDDLKLLYGISSGAVTPPVGPIWEPEKWFESDAKDRLARGLFSPFRTYRGIEDRSKMPFDKVMAMVSATGVTPGASGGPGQAPIPVASNSMFDSVPTAASWVNPIRRLTPRNRDLASTGQK